MIVRTVAPAKINWTLEVLGKREDGYHEIRSVMQTIDLCDEVSVSSIANFRARTTMPDDLQPGTVAAWVPPQDFVYISRGDESPTGDVQGGSVIRVVDLLDPEGQREVRTKLTKRIPIASGLGGGSSDAAGALRTLNRLWKLELTHDQLAQFAREIGSDVTFFLSGGTALAEARGEKVTPLPDVPAAWVVVLAPPIRMVEKTKAMYGTLRPGDFTAGPLTANLVDRLKAGEAVRDEDMWNGFARAAYESFDGLAEYRDGMLAAGAKAVHLSGAGPALFAVFGSREEADGVAARLEESDARVFVARTLGAEEATALVLSE